MLTMGLLRMTMALAMDDYGRAIDRRVLSSPFTSLRQSQRRLLYFRSESWEERMEERLVTKLKPEVDKMHWISMEASGHGKNKHHFLKTATFVKLIDSGK